MDEIERAVCAVRGHCGSWPLRGKTQASGYVAHVAEVQATFIVQFHDFERLSARCREQAVDDEAAMRGLHIRHRRLQEAALTGRRDKAADISAAEDCPRRDRLPDQ